MINKEEFLINSLKTLGDVFDMLAELPSLNLTDLKKEQTALVLVDMINGFAREGALKSPRVEGLIPVIAGLSKLSDELDIPKIAFADHHTGISPEFESYPQHCVIGSYEEEIVDELKEIGGYKLIPKNSTNGFLEPAFQEWLIENKHIDTYIVAGDCTDICIQQFAITMKTYFNMLNRKSRIIVPVNAVDTYDLGLHNGDLMHVAALYNMIINGVEVVMEVK